MGSGMMSGNMMSGGMTFMVLGWALGLFVLVLAAAALVKYLFRKP